MKIARPNSRKSSTGFTLIELIVVISIILILGGLMFPAANGALRKAEKSHAENEAHNLKNAISAYFTEYRKYPVDPKDSPSETDEMLTDNKLMDVLLGSDPEAEPGGLNPRRIAFYTGKQAKKAGGGKFRKGVSLEADGTGELWDPWGEYFSVRLDLDYNSRVEKPQWDTTTDATVLPQSILIWSKGRDKEEETWKDNVKTW